MPTTDFGTDVQAAADHAIRRGRGAWAGDGWRARVAVDGHPFCIHPVQVTRLEAEQDAVAVRIHLSHLRPEAPEQQVHYTAVIDRGAMLFQELTIDDGGGLFPLLAGLASAAAPELSGVAIRPSVLVNELSSLLSGDPPSAARYLVAVTMLRLADARTRAPAAGYAHAGRTPAATRH